MGWIELLLLNIVGGLVGMSIGWLLVTIKDLKRRVEDLEKGDTNR